MISFIGIISLPILLLSLIFVFFHAKFIRLHSSYDVYKNRLIELKEHKLELLLFFAQDVPEAKSIAFDEEEGIIKLEELLANFDFSYDDKEELADIANEIEVAQNMYDLSKAELVKFTDNFFGKVFVTFLSGKLEK